MTLNQNSGYGQAVLSSMTASTSGRTFVVGSTTEANINFLNSFLTPDPDGVQRLHATVTSALAACTADYGDVILLANDFATALTAAELLSAETKGVSILPLGPKDGVGYFADRATAALPATTAEAIFTVTGKVKVLSIVGEVTTIIQTQANNTKLVANPTVGADVDLCAVNDISADAVGTNYNITGTLADAMVATTSGAGVYQAAPLIVTAGTIDLNCAATNTGSVKWKVHYQPLEQGARILSA